MDGFTGLNLDSAGSQIENFYDEAVKIKNNLDQAKRAYFEALYNYWASGVAYDFSKKFGNKFDCFEYEFSRQFMATVNGARHVMYDLAMINGVSLNTLKDKFWFFEEVASHPDAEDDWIYDHAHENFWDVPEGPASISRVCEVEKNGLTGMAIENVKIISEEFFANLKNIADSIDSLPRSIEFYDPDATLKRTYSTQIEKFSGELLLLIDEITAEMQNCIESETNRIEFAKEQATNMLNG